MGENLTCLGKAAVAACVLAISLSGAALAQGAPSSKRDTPRGVAGAKGATGAPGAIVQYEEAASTGILYLEESGGMARSASEPVKAATAAAAPIPAPASTPRAASAPVASAVPGKLAQRRAPADAAKP